jgi:hypothetical protein
MDALVDRLLGEQLRTVGGIARRRMAPFVHPSRPRSTSWKACSHTRERPADLRSPLRLGAAEKSTFSIGGSFGAGAPAK